MCWWAFRQIQWCHHCICLKAHIWPHSVTNQKSRSFHWVHKDFVPAVHIKAVKAGFENSWSQFIGTSIKKQYKKTTIKPERTGPVCLSVNQISFKISLRGTKSIECYKILCPSISSLLGPFPPLVLFKILSVSSFQFGCSQNQNFLWILEFPRLPQLPTCCYCFTSLA